MKTLLDVLRWMLLRVRAQRGQILIFVAMVIIPLSAAVGIIAVDVSTWQSERRGAQKDADYAALAGAYELLDVQDGTTADNARTAADAYQDKNDEAGNAEIADNDDINDIIVDNSCFNSMALDGVTPLLDSVSLNVRHKSRVFFGEVFGINLAPDIGAHARACMGSPIEGEGLLPLGVQVRGVDSNCFEPDPNDTSDPPLEVPVFGQYCQLAFAGSSLTSGEGGFLKLFDDGALSCSANNASSGVNELTGEIEAGGANTTCYVAPQGTTSDDCDGPPPADWPFPYVNYCVWPKTGTFSNPIQNSFTTMIEGEGECDQLFGNGDGIDDWLEVVEAVNGDPNPDPGTTTFAKRDCDSPRLVNLIIIDQFVVNGNGPSPIVAFASFYIESCIIEELDGTLTQFRTCDVSGGQLGQAQLHGFFMNIIQLGTLGAANKYGQRSIALWE